MKELVFHISDWFVKFYYDNIELPWDNFFRQQIRPFDRDIAWQMGQIEWAFNHKLLAILGHWMGLFKPLGEAE